MRDLPRAAEGGVFSALHLQVGLSHKTAAGKVCKHTKSGPTNRWSFLVSNFIKLSHSRIQPLHSHSPSHHHFLWAMYGHALAAGIEFMTGRNSWHPRRPNFELITMRPFLTNASKKVSIFHVRVYRSLVDGIIQLSLFTTESTQ